MKFDLEFLPNTQTPTEPGDYVLYNQCDGYHIVEASFADDGAFEGFYFFGGRTVGDDFYRAWAKLPESHTTMFDAFGRDCPQCITPQVCKRDQYCTIQHRKLNV